MINPYAIQNLKKKKRKFEDRACMDFNTIIGYNKQQQQQKKYCSIRRTFMSLVFSQFFKNALHIEDLLKNLN